MPLPERFAECAALPPPDAFSADPARRRVVFFAADLGGCGYARCFVPACALEAAGRWEAIVTPQVVPALAARADVIVWQRQAGEQHLRLAAALEQAGKKQVYEIDDDLHAIPHTNPAFTAYNDDPRALPAALAWMRAADAVLTSTAPLAEVYAGRTGRGCVTIGNTIDLSRAERFAPRRSFDRVRLLWAGSATHIDDLALVREALPRVKARHGKDVKLLLMGFDGKLALPGAVPRPGPDGRTVVEGRDLGLRPDRFVAGVPVDDYHATLHGLAPDIGLAPLEDNPFNRCKSAIKWLEYTLAGAATVASNVGPYAAAIEHGRTGLLVENRTEAWTAALDELIAKPALRAALVAGAREAIRARHDALRVHEAYEALFAALGC